MRLPIALLSLAATLSGCVTYQTVRPAIAGQVVTADRHAPIPSACLSSAPSGDFTFTDTQGHFALPARRDWQFYPLIFPVDHFPVNQLTVSKKGYLSRELTISGAARQRGFLIELQRAPAKP